jgi:periplasmic protein TonB
MAEEFPITSISLEERRQNQSISIVASLLLHASAITMVIVLAGINYHSDKFRRPPTFSLVNFPLTPPKEPVSQPPRAREQVKQAPAEKQPSAPAPQTEQPQAEEATPDLTEKNALPAAEPVPSAAATTAIGGASESTGGIGQAGDADRPVAIGSTSVLDNTNFSPIFNPKPAYPAIALKANIQGYVDVELVVTPAGAIESFSILKVAGHPAFGDETVKVMRRWRFPPPRIGGKPTKIRYDYRVNFTLD